MEVAICDLKDFKPMEQNEVAIIQNKILVIRNQQVMIDRDIAELYGVETRVLNQAVKRNAERFPEDFCFQLNDSEFENWKSQIVISNSEKMGIRKKPFAFTEHGVTMLSAVLKSETAVNASIQIVKAFVAMRRFLVSNAQIQCTVSAAYGQLYRQNARPFSYY